MNNKQIKINKANQNQKKAYKKHLQLIRFNKIYLHNYKYLTKLMIQIKKTQFIKTF